MIACACVVVAGLGVVEIVAIRYGYGPVQVARKAVEGSGVRRITSRQLRHELRLAQHQLAGAGQYITGLENDRQELSGLLEQRTGELDTLKEQLAKAGQQIVERDQQLAAFDATCAENTRLRAELDNARAMRQLHPGPSPADDASALPDAVQEFVDATATAWRVRA